MQERSDSRVYLDKNAAILHSPVYQSAIVKIQVDEIAQLTPEEEESILDFKITSDLETSN